MQKKSSLSVALVLAGTRGLGFACAERLAADGNSVAICGRNEDNVKSAEEKIAKYGPSLGVVADVSDPDSLRLMVNKVRNDLGPIKILVASAGGPPAGRFETVSSEDWEKSYSLTLMSFVHSVHAVLPDMRSAGNGRVVVIGSSSIRRPIPNLSLSNTFRPALNGLIKDLSVEFAVDGITVNMVAPGRIDTERVRLLDQTAAEQKGCSVDEVKATSQQNIPIGRYGRTEEFAAVIGFLASDDASYITGQSILVDGGMTASLP